MNRKTEITIYTVLMCFMVVYIHTTSEAVTGYDKEQLPYALAYITNRLCSFVVPGFVFISAVKYFLRDTSFGYARFLKDRLRRIYLPYVCWVALYYAYFVRQDYFPFSLSALAGYILLGNLAANFYFVVIIMQFYLLMPLWRKLAETKNPAAVLTVCAVIMYVTKLMFIGYRYNDRVLTSYLFYWAAGVFCGLNYARFTALCRKYLVPCAPLCLAVAAAHIGMGYMSSRGVFHYRYAEHMQMLFCVTSLLFVFALCVFAAPYIRFAFLNTIADASYYIYLSHVLLIIYIQYHTPGLGITATLLVKAAAAFTVPALLSVIYVKLKRRLLAKT